MTNELTNELTVKAAGAVLIALVVWLGLAAEIARCERMAFWRALAWPVMVLRLFAGRP